jgi:uncharacterized membrane protein
VSYYEVLLFLHIATAVIWLGSGFFVQMLIMRAEKTSDLVLLKQFSGYSAWMAQRIFIPASLAVLVFGILLTIEGPWTFGQLWIVLGLAGYAFSFLVGIGFMEPEGKRIHAAIEAHGPESSQARFHIRRINVVSRMELVVLYLVVYVMALKPTGEDTGTLIVAAGALLGALAYGVPKLRQPTPEASAATAD